MLRARSCVCRRELWLCGLCNTTTESRIPGRSDGAVIGLGDERQELSPDANDGPCSQNEGKLTAFGWAGCRPFAWKRFASPVNLRFEGSQRTEASGLANLVGKRQESVQRKCLEEDKLSHRNMRKCAYCAYSS